MAEDLDESKWKSKKKKFGRGTRGINEGEIDEEDEYGDSDITGQNIDSQA